MLFDDAGLVHLPGWGKKKVYSAINCHSLYDHVPLFVDNGNLMLLNDDYTASIVLADVGESPMFYTTVGNLTYFCNQIITGIFDAIRNSVMPWGIDRPPRQPDLTLSTFGGLYAGEYRVAITWQADSESGTGQSRKITVPEGGGINLANFPAPPALVTRVNVYVSSVNGKDLYFYGNYPATTNYVTIGRLTPQNVLPSLPLTTQFCTKPQPQGMISAFNGRIYWALDNYLYYTTTRNYNLRKANERFVFEGKVLAIHSVPPFLFVQTDEAVYSITSIDAEGAAPQLNRIKNYGGAAGLSCHGTDYASAYGYSDNGMIQCINDGTVKELTFNDNALQLFDTGALNIFEMYGSKFLVFTGTNGRANPLANSGN